MYRNSQTKGNQVRGFEALSRKLGEEIWNDQLLLHDDGILGYGGTRTFGIGGQGSGKTTLNTKIARMTYFIDGMNRQDFIQTFKDANEADDVAGWQKDVFRKHVHSESTLWRGREFDSWNILVPEIHKEHYPNEYCKPLRVHVHKKSNLEFMQQVAKIDANGEEMPAELVPIPGLDVVRYSSVAELYNNLVDGGNNIIYPPVRHFMSARLKDAINTKRNMSVTDRRYLVPEVDYLVERDIFLFEIFEYLYRANLKTDRRRWFTSIIDESHDLFRSNAPDIYYWIIECMVDVLVDTRKHNLSLACMTHALNLIDYRILERASHFIWMRGAKPTGSYSQVDTRLIKKLMPGQGVIEACMDGKIGGFIFERNPGKLSRLVVTGMAADVEEARELPADEFAGHDQDEEVEDDEIRAAGY